MIITSSSLVSASTHSLTSSQSRTVSLAASLPAQAETANGASNPPIEIQIQVSLPQVSLPQASAINQQSADTDFANIDIRLMFIKAYLEKLTGTSIELIKFEEPSPYQGPQVNPGTSPSQADPSSGFSLRFSQVETYEESEQSLYTTSGVIRTSDGQEHTIDFELQLSRQFISSTRIDLRAGDAAKDPLILNFDGLGARFSEETFLFDLDIDGNNDIVVRLEDGSGFLALDKNNDGIINDGSELFGPRTGLGFNELSQYDDDNNAFIDEGDAIFHLLRIWSPGEDNQNLKTLGEAGVGALYLNAIDTPFRITDSSNNTTGLVTQSSVFLNDDFTPGALQQIDLVI